MCMSSKFPKEIEAYQDFILFADLRGIVSDLYVKSQTKSGNLRGLPPCRTRNRMLVLHPADGGGEESLLCSVYRCCRICSTFFPRDVSIIKVQIEG